MKKITNRVLLIALIISVLFSAAYISQAASHTFTKCATPAPTYEPNPTGDVGAWSYIKVTPVSGASSRTHYVFSNYQTTTLPIEGKVESVNGMKYSKKTNTLTIKNFDEEDIILLIHNMGTGFTVKITGTNTLRSLKVENENWDSGLTVVGSGKLTLGNAVDHNNVPFDVNGTTELLGGTIKCLAEKTEIQSVGGLRYSFLVCSAEKYPLHTALKSKGTLEANESANNTALVRSTEDITFTGKALKTPGVKRSGKKVSWSKVKGCRYQVKSGNKIITTRKTCIKNKGKVQVRAIKIQNGIMTCSSWSKKI